MQSDFGFPEVGTFVPGRCLDEGESVTVGNIVLAVHHCPGHAPGHVVFHDKRSRLAIVGDVLFQGSVGPTDFPKGNHEDLIRSIRERLWPLGDDVRFFPGRGRGGVHQPLRR